MRTAYQKTPFPFLDQTLCERSGGLVGRVAKRVPRFIRNRSIGHGQRCHSSHEIAIQSSHSVQRAERQAKLASVEF